MFGAVILIAMSLSRAGGVEQNTCDCTCMCSPKVDIFIPPSSGVVTTHGTVPTPIATIVLRDCPADFYMFNHTCYYVTQPASQSTNDEASELCSAKNDNAALVTVDSVQELHFLTRNIIKKKYPVTGLYWTGGRSSDRAWYWERTGSRVSNDILELMPHNTTVMPGYCLFVRSSDPPIFVPLPCKERYYAGAACEIPLP